VSNDLLSAAFAVAMAGVLLLFRHSFFSFGKRKTNYDKVEDVSPAGSKLEIVKGRDANESTKRAAPRSDFIGVDEFLSELQVEARRLSIGSKER
jgi:hypothetical protein